MRQGKRLHFIAVCSLVFLLSSLGSAQNPGLGQSARAGGVATLYALDPLSRTLSFRDGAEGNVIQVNEMRNRDSQLDFDQYKKNNFTVGIQGNETGLIIDLGTPAELQKRYGYSETAGLGQGFASLHMEDWQVVIFKDRKNQSYQPLAEYDWLSKPTENKVTSSAEVQLGHIYLARITDKRHTPLLTKFLVLSFKPGESVTIRWQVL